LVDNDSDGENDGDVSKPSNDVRAVGVQSFRLPERHQSDEASARLRRNTYNRLVQRIGDEFDMVSMSMARQGDYLIVGADQARSDRKLQRRYGQLRVQLA